MIHKIKGLFDDGKGLSVRAISRELGVSRNTVRKYLKQDEGAISEARLDPARPKRLDDYRDFLINQLKAFPLLSAVKLARRLRKKVGELPVADRSIRRYVQALKQRVASGQFRYYEPVVEGVPGVQCQIDPGELRGVLINGVQSILYFVVFVLSYSRLMYVGVSFRPLDTTRFIGLHDEAFRFFGGVPEECVYDQTKMVVISEQYRELTLNQRFHQYATTVGYRIHACEGYDPESKGKVEAGVKYVKQDCLYGEVFSSEPDVRQHLQDWLTTVANVRTHGTTGRQPRAHFDADEHMHLQPYLAPQSLLGLAQLLVTRQADKTSLISWKSNKYSVPMAWQQARVGVSEIDAQLLVSDIETGEVIAQHALCAEKGRIIKNKHHYRDHAQRLIDLETAVVGLLPAPAGDSLCRLLKRTSPRIYKDQLVAARDLLRLHTPIDDALLADLLARDALTATMLRDHLEASRQAHERGRDTDQASPEPPSAHHANLAAYARVGQSAGQGVTQ